MGDASSSAVETPVVEGENAERRVVFDHLIATDSAAGVAVIPAEPVHLHHVQLPIRGARQRLAAGQGELAAPPDAGLQQPLDDRLDASWVDRVVIGLPDFVPAEPPPREDVRVVQGAPPWVRLQDWAARTRLLP